MKINKTPQDITNQSQLPNNSSPVTGVVDSCIKTLKQILTPEEQKVCEDSNNHFESLLIQFREEVETISNRIGYNYEGNGYERKLGIFDNVKEKELERLFKENPKLKNLFNEIIEKSNIDSETTKNVLIKEGLEDLILENMEEVSEYPSIFHISQNIKYLIRDDLEEIGDMIREFKCTNIDYLSRLNLYEIFQNDTKAFESFIKTAGESGIRILNLQSSDLYEIFQNDTKAFESFIKTAGESGIRSLDLSANTLYKIFQNDTKAFESFIKTAGESGIRSLDLHTNSLYEIFQNDTKAFESFIKTAGESGIRRLNLGHNGLEHILQNNPQAFMSFIKIADESGIRGLELKLNGLHQILSSNLEVLIDILDIIEQGNIKYLFLGYFGMGELSSSNPTFKTQFESKIKELKKKGKYFIYNDD